MKPGDDTVELTTPTTGTTISRMRGNWTYLGYIVWVASTLLMVIPTLVGIGPRYQALLAEAAGGIQIGGAVMPAQTYATLITTLAGIYATAFVLMALLIFSQRPKDWVAILSSLLLVAIGTSGSDFSTALVEANPNLIFLVDWIRSVGLGLPVVVLFLFPSGLAVPTWTRYLAFAHVVYVLLRPFFVTVEAIPLHPNYWSAGTFFLWYAFWLGIGLYAQVYRYRNAASPAQRQQTKWVLYGIFVGAGGFLLIQLVRAVAPAIDPTIDVNSAAWFVFEYPTYVLIGLPIPISVAISVLRFRLWDIDFIINKSLVYGTLTALLVGLFGVSLVAINNIATAMASSQQALIAVAVAAMVFGMVFGPARRQLQRFVDRNFYNIQIDYERVGRQSTDKRPKPVPVASVSLGEYGELELIGHGGMADVYRAMHPTLKRMVAIKLMQDKLIEKDDFLQRFKREADIMAELDHENVVSLLDYGDMVGKPFMVMEYIDGRTISQALKDRTRFALPDAITMLRELADALDYIHEQGLVHRDIKASNIMVEETDTRHRTVLMDFGIARVMGSTSQLTSTGVVGTFFYMAPEQIQQAYSVDRRADIYSLGVLTYQMVTGELPFDNVNPGAVLIAHLQQPPPDPRKVQTNLPRGAAKAIMRAMEKRPEQRQATAGEFVDELEAALGLRAA